MSKPIVLFPMDTEKEAKIKRLLETMAEFMGAQIEVKTRIRIVMTIDTGDRSDVEAIIRKFVVGMAK